VVNVDVHTRRDSQGRTTTTRDYDVRFTVNGRDFRVNGIGGVHFGEQSTGDVVDVAFPPGEPERAVWASTLEGGQRILLFIGLAVGLAFGGLGSVILILGLRRRSTSAPPVEVGAGVASPVLADPGAADEIGRPWTFDEIVGGLVRGTAGSPYVVDRSGDSVTVHINLADTSWWALLQRQGLTKTFSTP
jgi:hypothetical protein